MWNLLLGVKGLRYNPSVSLRLPAPFSREPKISLPFRKGNQRSWWRDTEKQTIFLPNAVYASPCKKIVGFHGDFL